MVLLVVWVAGAAPCLAVAGVWGVAEAAAAAAAAALVPLMVALLHFYCGSTEGKQIHYINANRHAVLHSHTHKTVLSLPPPAPNHDPLPVSKFTLRPEDRLSLA